MESQSFLYWKKTDDNSFKKKIRIFIIPFFLSQSKIWPHNLIQSVWEGVPFVIKKWMGWGGSFLLLFILGQSTPSDPGQKQTLKEAVNLGWHHAIAWDSQAVLISVSSVDDEHDEGVKGNEGRRRFWNLIFAVAEQERSLILMIRDGKVQQKETQDVYRAAEGIQLNELIVDSPQLVKKARKEYHLLPGVTWAEGYHFVLFKSGNIPFTAVVGLNQREQYTKIYFDPRDGSYLGMTTTSK